MKKPSGKIALHQSSKLFYWRLPSQFEILLPEHRRISNPKNQWLMLCLFWGRGTRTYYFRFR